jgi:hypothetical protein
MVSHVLSQQCCRVTGDTVGNAQIKVESRRQNDTDANVSGFVTLLQMFSLVMYADEKSVIKSCLKVVSKGSGQDGTGYITLFI